MKKLIIFLFLMISNIIVCQNIPLKNNDSIIIWNKNKNLNWKDFKNSKKDSVLFKENPYYANSAVGLFLTYEIDGNKIKFFVYSKFEKYNSSVLFKTDYLLNHEQLHFDIVEVFARKLRKEFLLLKQKNAVFDEYLTSFTKMRKDMYDYEYLYDKETVHSNNKIKQQEWNVKIKDELKKMENYSFENYRLVMDD